MKKPQTGLAFVRSLKLSQRDQKKFDNVHDTIKKVGEIVTATIIMTSFVSVIIGEPVLRLYLKNYTMVASPADLFSPTILMFFMVFLLWILSTCVVFFLAPFTVTFLAGREARENFPYLFGGRFTRLPPPATSPTLRSRLVRIKLKAKPFTKDYASFYLPMVLLSFTVPVVTYLQVSQRVFVPEIPWIFLVIFSFGTITLYHFRLRSRPGWGDTYSAFFIGNFLTSLWIIFVELAVYRALGWSVGHVAALNKTPATLGITLLVLLVHFGLSYMKFSAQSLIGFTIIIATVLGIYPGYSEIGASALREAQLGGGIRIAYGISSISNVDVQRKRVGCLILATTAYLLISNEIDKSCPSLRRFAFSAAETKPRNLIVIPRNQVDFVEQTDEPPVTSDK